MALRRARGLLGFVAFRFTSSHRSLWTVQEVLNTRKSVDILESHMSYLDTGEKGKNSVVFLHGNPTAAFLWRGVIPHVQPVARCLAPDLLGMGHSGKEPNNLYRFNDHYEYLSEWMDKLVPEGPVNLVVHDWGASLAFHWAHEHRRRMQSITYMESVTAIPTWADWPEQSRSFFQALRSPAGEEMILKKNLFIERLLPGSILRQLKEGEMEEYRRPYANPGDSRLPMLTWPREAPIDNSPAVVAAIVHNYRQYLANTELPKLFIDAEPGFFSPVMRNVVKHWPNQRTAVVKGLHFIQEDSPDEIGIAIAEFLTDVFKS
jgi:pimeloyl-ACP methyl ester carboxylesterase